jgi:hypothetical protein
MDELQATLRPFLKELRFRARSKAFIRLTPDGLTQVIEFQLGMFDPPGTHSVGFPSDLYRKFMVNVGVYVPEVYKYSHASANGDTKAFVHEYDCDIRERLGKLGPEHRDIWWDLDAAKVHDQAADVFQRLERDAFTFFSQFEDRDAILNRLMREEQSPFTNRPRIVCAMILAARRTLDEAQSLLIAQAKEHDDRRHLAFLRTLADKLGLA